MCNQLSRQGKKVSSREKVAIIIREMKLTSTDESDHRKEVHINDNELIHSVGDAELLVSGRV